MTPHRSKYGLVLGLALGVGAAAACHKDPVVTTRTVTAYVPAACPVDASAYAQYLAYGDFDPPPAALSGHLLSSVGQELPEVYGATRELVVTVTPSSGDASSQASSQGWAGVSAVAGSGDVSVLVLPVRSSCPLTTTVGPGTVDGGVFASPGATVAAIGGGRVMVVGASALPGQTGQTYVARLDTGEVDTVSPSAPRTYASVTPFGDGALVAGGMSIDGFVLDTIEVYSPSTGLTQPNGAKLDEPRMQHGAVVLASGQTLLVGGVGQDGTKVLGSLETVDSNLGVNEGGLGQLATARRNPTVLRLASAEILVAGGFDANGKPVQTLEWFAPDGTQGHKQTITLAQGSKRAFVALEGGGALAVVTPPDGTPECPAPQDGQPPCTEASCGCFQNVWVIDASGAPEPAALIASDLPDPALFGGAGGAPVLWTGARWLQWQPYLGAFGPLSVLDATPASMGTARCSPDPGLALWLDDTTGALTLLRFDTRNAYSPLPAPLLVQGPEETSPDAYGGVEWNPGAGGLVLDPGAAAFVTDRTYADVAVDLGVPTGAPPQIALRDSRGNELDVGGTACAAPATSSIHVERRGATVAVSVDGGPSTACSPVPFDAAARVSVGVRGVGPAPSIARDLVVTRLGQP